MVTLLTGKKGSGKTKKLIELVNSALEKSNGNVVVIEKSKQMTYNIPYHARLVDTDAYDIKGNYDVTDIFVDSTLKITGTGAEACSYLVPQLKKLSQAADTNFVLSISAAEEDIPGEVADCVLK